MVCSKSCNQGLRIKDWNLIAAGNQRCALLNDRAFLKQIDRLTGWQRPSIQFNPRLIENCRQHWKASNLRSKGEGLFLSIHKLCNQTRHSKLLFYSIGFVLSLWASASFASVLNNCFFSVSVSIEKNISSFLSAILANLGTSLSAALVSFIFWNRRSSTNSLRLTSPFCRSLSMSLETAPRVNPVNLATKLGDVSASREYISLRITHSATVTSQVASFRAKAWETEFEMTRKRYPRCDLSSLTSSLSFLAMYSPFSKISFLGNKCQHRSDEVPYSMI